MIRKIYLNPVNEGVLEEIVTLLSDGGIVVYPTDTVYAVGCSALNFRGVERICAIKGVKPDKANLSIVCADISQASEYVTLTNDVFKLLKKNLPGPFTFLLNAGRNLPKVFKNRKTVGVRVPDHPVAKLLADRLGHPLLSMSVVRDEDGYYLTNPELIDEHYGDRVDCVVDAGEGGFQVSTIVDCTDGIEIIRQGAVELIY